MPGSGVSQSSPLAAPLPAPLYQGSVNTWECDDGGHLNVRFHLERAMSGLAFMANALAMPRAMNAGAAGTIVPLELHAKFLKEARPGAALIMRGGVLDLNETDARICVDMRHADGAPASAFCLKISHVDPRVLKPFPWSSRTRTAAAALACAMPDHAKARSIDLSKAPTDASAMRADALGLARIGGAYVTPDQCDALGRLRGEQFFGRVSDSVPNLLSSWRRAAAEANGGAVEPAGAVVEARLVFRRWPRAGDLLEVRSGVAEVGEKTLRLVHWVVDPATGAAWASLEAVALTFDIATRKAIAPSDEARKAMNARVVKGLAV
jgi:acyl-CoA thioester hydrolase